MRAAIVFVLMTMPLAARAQSESRPSSPFSQGRISASALIGTGGFAGERSTIVGATLGYYVLDGLQLGVEGDYWFGGSSLARVSPAITYTVVAIPRFQPYAGVFYRHWFTDSIFEDIDTIGARGGVNWVTGTQLTYLGLGVAYEAQVSPECPSGADCDYFYPELTLAIAL